MARTRVLSEMLDGPPPADRHAEMALVGSLMLDPGKREVVRAIVSAEDFYQESCGVLYGVLLSLDAVDAVILIDALRVAGKLEIVGGRTYIAECIQSVAVAAHAVHYAEIVREKALKRQMVELNRRALVALYSGKWTAAELAQRQIIRLQEIVDRLER